MPEFQPIRYLRRGYGLAIAAAVLAAAFVFFYAAHAQRYVAAATIEYTGSFADRGQNPDGSAIDPQEMFSAARVDELARALGLQESVQELRSGFAAEMMVMGLDGEWLGANSTAGQQAEYGPAGQRTAYRITFKASGSRGGAYAGDVLRTLLSGYAAWYGERHVVLEPQALPGGLENVPAADGEYIDRADGLIAAARESVDALNSRAESYPAFRSAATGYAPADLAAEYAFILDEDLTKLRSDILADGAARDRAGLLARWNAELTEYEADLGLARGRAEQIKALMAQMNAASAQAEAQIAEPVLVAEGQAESAAAYDVLARRYAQALIDMIGCEAELRACEGRIASFSDAGEDGFDARRVEDGIAEAAGRLAGLHALALETDAELRAWIAAQSLTLREGVTVRGTVDVRLYTLLGAVFGGLLGILLAIFAGRIREILRMEPPLGGA